MSVGIMGIVLFAADRGFLDDVPLNRIAMFEQELVSFLTASHSDFVNELTNTGNLNDDIIKKMTDIITTFKTNQSWD